MPKEYWEQVYKELDVKELQYDAWLDKYEAELQRSISVPIIDLGCGLGNNTLYLKERGYKVISCDYSEEALSKLKKLISNSDVRQFDMTEGIPFEDNSAGVIIADLSLHYFPKDVTFKILEEIRRVLKEDGLLLCRVNSNRDVNYGAIDQESYYYQVNGLYKRFFDRNHINHLFKDFSIDHIEEYEMNRYSKGKIVWEIAARKKQ
ncbi:class I SAM-dependent methyltransferase [Marinicrinis lubricantis]|uniref:Class I SAM-dependent methyltransferase n=1 Tax=Marinicrinis lubricantis TaxID=2086470 RepID=A0ABW1IPH3_9BACL